MWFEWSTFLSFSFLASRERTIPCSVYSGYEPQGRGFQSAAAILLQRGNKATPIKLNRENEKATWKHQECDSHLPAEQETCAQARPSSPFQRPDPSSLQTQQNSARVYNLVQKLSMHIFFYLEIHKYMIRQCKYSDFYWYSIFPNSKRFLKSDRKLSPLQTQLWFNHHAL